MGVQIIQQTFQFGEVSPLLHAKVDSPIYYRSVKRLRNCIVTPQSNAERRFGMNFIDEINDQTGPPPTYFTDYTQVKPFIFDYENGDKYLLIFVNNAILVYYNGAYQSKVTTTYTAAQIADIQVAQSANIMFIVHPAHAPATLVRSGTGPITLTLATPTFINPPTFDFANNYNGYTFTVTDVGTAAPIAAATNLTGQIVDVTSSVAMFSTDFVGGLFFGDAGVIRFETNTSTTVMRGRLINVFDSDSRLLVAPNTISGADCVVTSNAFRPSTSTDYPSHVSFFQNRLFFANTDSLPGGVWGSNYNGFSATALNFDDSGTLDTNAISTLIQGKKASVVKHLSAFKTLLVHTSSGLYSTPLLIDLPLTPTNMSFVNLQTSDSTGNVQPVVFDNDVIFFDKGGKKVKAINVMSETQHYETRTISVLASHLIDQPYSASVFENSSERDGSWMFMVNTGTSTLLDGQSMDGALSIYQAVPEQEITAWSLSTSPGASGKFRHVVADEDEVYFIVERVVNGNTRLFIEQLDFDTYLDAQVTRTPSGSPAVTVSNLDYLEGEEVRVIADGNIVDSKTVSSGQITLDEAASSVDVGLNWTPEIVPLPLNIPTQFGNDLYLPKSVKRLYVDFYESNGIYVNGDLIPTMRMGTDVYDSPETSKTDFVTVEPFNGWDPRQEISITQQDPLPMTIIGLGYNIVY